MKGNNNAYNEMDMDVSVKGRLLNNCMNYMDNIEKSKENDNIIEHVFETYNYVDNKKNKIEKIVKCAVAVVAVGAVGLLLSFGRKYVETPDDKVMPAKEAESEMPIEDDEAIYGFSQESVDGIFEHKYTLYEEPRYDKNLEHECYDEKGNLKEGYEVKEYSITYADGSKEKKKFVGKDFVYIDSEMVKKNASLAVKEFKSGLDDKMLEKYEDYCQRRINEMSKYDYVYFLQGTSLVRVRLDKKFTTWMNTSQTFSKLEMIESKVVAYLTASDINTNLTVKYIGFDDVNIATGSDYVLVNKDNKEDVFNELHALYFIIALQKDKNTAYYVDKDHILWRIQDVDIYTFSEDGIIPPSISAEYIEQCNYSHKIGVDKNFKAEKIAEGIYIADDENYNDWIEGENENHDKLYAYYIMLPEKKEYIKDDYVIYLESKDYNPLYTRPLY